MNFPNKKTKIVATLGPASRSEENVEKLIRHGVDVFRLNFSHGSHDEHGESIRTVLRVSERLGVHTGILADLQGPKIRTGRTENDGSIVLEAGRDITLTKEQVVCTANTLCIDYPRLLDEISAGQLILLNDGAVALEVASIEEAAGKATCRVLNTGVYSSRKGVNLPHTNLSIPAMTEKDHRDLAFIIENNVSLIALSFVRHARDLAPLNEAIAASGKFIKVIAKIEKPEATERIDEILDYCDGIMVARGDLGIEASPYNLPVLQKQLISNANAHGKFVIVATQMLESMIEHPRPTRAETTDVANAILDGTDAIMLSGETSVGHYPVETVKTMTMIAQNTEACPYYNHELMRLDKAERNPAHALCDAAAWASRDLDNVPVIVFTVSGDTVHYISNIRNTSPIYAFTPHPWVARMLSLGWNIQPFTVSFTKDLVTLEAQAEQILLDRGLVKPHDLVLVISGTTPVRGATNLLRVKRISEF